MNLTQQLSAFDTAEISDALDACGIEGALLGIKPISPGVKFAGPAFTVKYIPYAEKPVGFKNAGNYIDSVPPHSVIVIDNNGRLDCTTWGDILTQAAQLNNLAGTVVYGAIRDAEFIRKVKYPLYASGIYMRSGKNRVFKSEEQCKLLINNIKICPGDIVIGDDNGVIIIPLSKANEVLKKTRNIKATEERIVASIKSGMKLEEARKLHQYDQPWLTQKDKI
jgi:regulator of RNase E activity RraA